MASSTTSSVYIHVIEDVINKIRDEFINNGGPGESVLNELQGIWEVKMMIAGAILGPIERSAVSKQTAGGPITPFHDLNVPYQATEEYETPTAEMLFPPTPLQTPIQTPLAGSAQTPLPGTARTPLPVTEDSSLYNIPTGGTPITPNDYHSIKGTGGVNELQAGRPSPYMQPPSAWMNPSPSFGVDVNVAYEEGREKLNRGTSQKPPMQDFFMMSSGKRKQEDLASQYHSGGHIPQQDGAGDAVSDDFQLTQGANTKGNIFSAKNREVFMQGTRLSSSIPQLDGPIPDPYDDVLSTPNIYNYQGPVNEDYNIVNTPAPIDQAGIPTVVIQNDVGDDDDDEPLNENDDDDDVDDVDQREEMNTQHLVLAQFEKVTRAKSRWKCTLKDGIMHINNKDILFNKVTGEFDF
ncbi:transcription initiation factor IIA large subunit-like isoform X1 [Actinidia eriantha]|uniref:transcription initiation factor IIA large subunit-like isoform X1 n=1 Tax=Actinidia eriantha TaxID=165200 RepID=UPI00258C231F|nr:transcription initiation factor IIA large subunit-like isoform X1 [Actinidia eriantha]